MRNETWEALDSLFSETPILKAEQVDFAEIVAAERKLSLPLVDDYKEFIRRYGGAIVGAFPVYGLRKAEPMGTGQSSYLEVTEAFRQEGCHLDGSWWQSNWIGCRWKDLDFRS